MVVPKQVEKRMESLMGAFLWSQQGHHRTHWVSWTKVFRPLSEGGLGFRSFSDTVSAYTKACLENSVTEILVDEYVVAKVW